MTIDCEVNISIPKLRDTYTSLRTGRRDNTSPLRAPRVLIAFVRGDQKVGAGAKRDKIRLPMCVRHVRGTSVVAASVFHLPVIGAHDAQHALFPIVSLDR